MSFRAEAFFLRSPQNSEKIMAIRTEDFFFFFRRYRPQKFRSGTCLVAMIITRDYNLCMPVLFVTSSILNNSN